MTSIVFDHVLVGTGQGGNITQDDRRRWYKAFHEWFTEKNLSTLGWVGAGNSMPIPLREFRTKTKPLAIKYITEIQQDLQRWADMMGPPGSDNGDESYEDNETNYQINSIVRLSRPSPPPTPPNNNTYQMSTNDDHEMPRNNNNNNNPTTQANLANENDRRSSQANYAKESLKARLAIQSNERNATQQGRPQTIKEWLMSPVFHNRDTFSPQNAETNGKWYTYVPPILNDPDEKYSELQDDQKITAWTHIYNEMVLNHDLQPGGYGVMPQHFLAYLAYRVHRNNGHKFCPGSRLRQYEGRVLCRATFGVKRRALVLFHKMGLSWEEVLGAFTVGDPVQFLRKLRKNASPKQNYFIIVAATLGIGNAHA